MKFAVGVAAALATLFSVQGQAQAAEPVRVMVIGTYHFDNPGRDLNNVKADDVTKPARQAELEALAAALAEFRPTKIMVEAVPKSADLADARFAAFAPAALAKERSEKVQIGYRLAHRMGHAKVYAIDEQPGPGEPDYFPFDKVASYAKETGKEGAVGALMAKGGAAVARIEEMQRRESIPAILLDRNRPAAAAEDQAMYYEILRIGDAERQPGADLNAMWYLRNAKIFGKLAAAAEPGDRVVVVYGMGHNYWLRHFAERTPGFVNVDPVPYLERAAAAARR